MRTPKDRQIYFEGAQIPVQLVYGSDDSETEAVVKEISIENILKKQRKLLNRVERSEEGNLEKISSLDDNESKKKLIKEDNMKIAKSDESKSEILPHKIEELLPPSEGEPFPVDADELNKGLGIEGRHGNKVIETLNIPTVQRISPMDYNYNIVKEMIKNINDNGINNGARRTVQHYQSLLHSTRTPNLPLDQSIYNINSNKPKIMKVVSYYPVIPPVAAPHIHNNFNNNDKILDDYFPFVVHNPFNTMWSALTNIVEYGPEADQCKTETKTKRKKREIDDEQFIIPESILEDLSRNNARFGITRPNIMKLKVRRGGIAIAGPGGIATAGSGGTTIVGPGGTALTPPDATAVVGPGGRVVHITNFDSSQLKTRNVDLSQIIKHGKVVAHGPVVIYPSPIVKNV